MKKATILMCLLGTCVIGFSQQNRPGQPIGGIIVKGGRNPGGSMLVNVSGGVSTPASDTKLNSYLGSGKNVNLGIYAPFFTFGLNDNFTLGANINGSYAKIDGDVNATPKYNIVGETAAPTGAKSGKGNATAYTAEAGLQANFSFGKITLSPILNAAYFSFKQDGFKLTQSNQANGQTYDFKLYNQGEIKQNGFAFIPKFRIGYFPGKLGLHLESSYVLGPEITSSKTTLQPLNSANVEGNYQLDQLMAGKQIATVSTTAFKSVGFNVGISYALGKTRKKANASHTGDQPQNQSIVNTSKSNTKDRVATDSVFTGETNPTWQPQNQSIVNTSKSNTKDRVTTDSVFSGGTNPTGQPQNQNVVNTTKSNTKDRVTTDSVFSGGTNPTGQPQNQSIINTSKSNTKDKVATDLGATGGTNPTQPQNQSIVNTSKSNTKDRVTTDSVFNGGTNPTGQPQNQNVVNTTKSNTKDRVTTDSVFIGGTNPTGQPQNQSIINTSKSNTKDKVATDPGATGGTNPTQPQNQSIVNTSKSNTKDRVTKDSVFIGGTNPTGQPQNQSIINTTKSNTKDKVAIDPGATGGTNPTGQPQNQNVVNTTKSNTKDRVANENTVMMQVNYTGSVAELKNMKLSILGNGEQLPDGTPIVSGKVVKGSITGNGGGAAAASYAATGIVISQPETGDMGSATTDREGNFSITLGHDTLHRIYINNVEYGKIKIKESSNAAKPGEPIGGIVVKADRNPGGQMKIISNSHGEFTFTNEEAADFKFTIETPETNSDNGNAGRPGEPIGGIIVKGGRNPGGQMFTTTTNGNGDIEFKNLPAGNYKFTLTAPTEPKQYESFRKGWDGTVKGGSKAASKTINPLYEGNGNSGTNPLSNPSNAAKPGGPIGGIVVKGGRNPGGQMNIISDNNGEFTFTNEEAADFKFTIEIPETTAENGNAARPGGPIGGIVVKGGKNPGGQMFTTNANADGTIEFKNLPAGNYKFTLTAPTETKEYGSFRKGWDGTVKGGSK